jgi:hypothetical protein
MKTINILLIFTILAFGISCQQKTQQQEEETPAVTEEERADFKRIMPNFPSAAEFSAIIQSTGAEFTPSILTDPSLADQYTKTKEKSAAMLGMYMYDLGYCAAFQRSSYTEEYFIAAQMLAQNLGGEKGFLEMIMNRYEENINANDSVKAYFRETYQHAVQEFGSSEEEREYLRTIFLAGFYIEGLNNMLQVINTYPRDVLPDEQATLILMPIIRAVLRQKDNVYNLSKMLDEKVFELDRDVEYQNAFAQLNDTYEKLNVDQLLAENRIQEILNDDVLQELITRVDEIRDRILSVEG